MSLPTVRTRARSATRATTLLAVWALSTGVIAQVAEGPLAGDEVRLLISGNTLKGGWRARPYEFNYQPDGSVYGTIWTSPDRGEWDIDGDRFCQEWFVFFRSNRRCYEWYRSGDQYLLKNVDSFRTRDIRGRIVQRSK